MKRYFTIEHILLYFFRGHTLDVTVNVRSLFAGYPPRKWMRLSDVDICIADRKVLLLRVGGTAGCLEASRGVMRRSPLRF